MRQPLPQPLRQPDLPQPLPQLQLHLPRLQLASAPLERLQLQQGPHQWQTCWLD